ncbi:hypothetical protein ZIOFF_009698 [Zingiber officinale]|uniref:Uncharacterized protein n=1 Tax=Zingiber officinale TaxID=94328 RepID=A0A8J5LRM6_ZINOF|nr:hypothetical protein ZIOFF_009698 [Zingiber officinale]
MGSSPLIFILNPNSTPDPLLSPDAHDSSSLSDSGILPRSFLHPPSSGETPPTLDRLFLPPDTLDSAILPPSFLRPPSLLRRDSPNAALNASSLPSFRRGDSSLLLAPVIACYCCGFVFFLLNMLHISSFHEIVFDLIQKYLVDMKHLGSSGFAEGVHSIEDNVNFAEGSDGHPIGPNAASFMTELGLSVKKFSPLQAKSWKHIPAENKRMIYDRISVLGTRSRYIIGLGSGPKPVRSTSSDATSSSRSTNAALRERLKSTQDELANTKIQLANTQDELASIKSRQNMFEQILNRLAPGALDSLIQDSSSAPPPPPPS